MLYPWSAKTAFQKLNQHELRSPSLPGSMTGNVCQVIPGSKASQCYCVLYVSTCDELVILFSVLGQSSEQRETDTICEAGLLMTDQEYSRPCHS